MIADAKLTWDVFCKVVDNFGDAGVCWRIARQLAGEYGFAVRLWCDRLDVLARLAPSLDAARAEQDCEGVQVRLWPAAGPAAAPADVVIEAFACDLPQAYVTAMAGRATRPVWLNLEYLSAEPWVGGCHLLPSPHAHLPLVKYFFFPGFAANTGGLLRERDLLQRRSAFVADPTAAWATFGMKPPGHDEISVSLFGYENAALPDLLAAWSRSPTPIRCLIRPGRSLDQVAAIFGTGPSAAGDSWRQGRLSVHALPFCAQAEFDRLLWTCDLNFVRGEDSFVRAQWAARPLVWHIYPQQDEAHRRKLDAFLDLYCAELPAAAASACRRFWRSWNQDGTLDWDDFWQHHNVLADRARDWAAGLAIRHDLAKNLVDFVESRLK